ncbi:GNAT family N-acetyltransferase [Aeoliella sp.]|uniref:GNAT family N-acetyltransferase n=1 Tax=Aeoliella sp. TaxID=2795800 RepID=UPI003CCC229F
MNLQVQTIDRLDDLHSLRAAWERLDGGVVFRSFDWLTTWWQYYQRSQRERLAVVVVRDTSRPTDSQVIAIAPWYAESTRARGTVMRWLSSGEVCSDHLGVLCEPDAERRVAKHLAAHLAEADNWNRLELDALDADDSMMELFATELQSRGCRHMSRPEGQCWAIDLPSSWDEFLAMQSKSHRKQLRRTGDRVLESGAATWHTVTSESELDTAWPMFVDLHQRRRNSLGEPGCFASPRFSAFHAAVARKLLVNDQLRLGWIEMDGAPLAVEYHFAGPTATYAYQAGFDPERVDQNPGRLSCISAVKQAIDAGHTKFDLLRGDEPYKAHWRAKPHATYRLRVLARSHSSNWLAQTADLAESMAGALKAGLRPLVSPTPTTH